jgi:predicted ArsR family transcriptional regulator
VTSAHTEPEPPRRRELLLELLRGSGQPRGIAGLAEEMGVHANTVRFHLETLVRHGQVEQLPAEAAGPGRPPVLFRATHRMDPAGPTNYRLLARILMSHLANSSSDPAEAATELGRDWGPQVLDAKAAARSRSNGLGRGEALTRMTRALDDVGFAPEPPRGSRDSTIRLRHCPFLALVTGSDADAGAGHGELICRLHLGLMQGALTAWQAPVAVERLEPFVRPDLCVAHLVPRR